MHKPMRTPFARLIRHMATERFSLVIRRQPVSVRMSVKLIERLDALAGENGLTRSDVIEALVMMGIVTIAGPERKHGARSCQDEPI